MAPGINQAAAVSYWLHCFRLTFFHGVGPFKWQNKNMPLFLQNHTTTIYELQIFCIYIL